MRLRLGIFLLLCTGQVHAKKPVVAVVTSFNNAAYYRQNLDSLCTQAYENFRVIYVDDASSDGTGDLVQAYIDEHQLQDKITLVRNEQNKGALYNLYHAIHSCDDDEIIATVDGDDWLADTNVFAKINDAYRDENVWLTYGQYQNYPGKKGHCRAYPQQVVTKNSYRSHKWIASQLRTFYAGLFKQIALEDLQHEGEFMPTAWDLAMMFPMLEMAGGRHKFISDVLYTYNRETPLSDDKVYGRDRQLKYEGFIRAKGQYQRLAEKPWGHVERPLVVVVPSYNNKQWYKKNLGSIFSQEYKNYRVIYIDDASTDGTAELVDHYIKAHNQQARVTFVHNKTNMNALCNTYNAVHSCADDEIVVILDGDDWLPDPQVLSKINDAYADKNVWLTLGGYETLAADGTSCIGTWPVYSKEMIEKNTFRTVPGYCWMALRSFYASLYKRIKQEDLQLNGNFYPVFGDAAYMVPMLEMAAGRHHVFNEVVYIYNTANALNDKKKSRGLFARVDRRIKEITPYAPLATAYIRGEHEAIIA